MGPPLCRGGGGASAHSGGAPGSSRGSRAFPAQSVTGIRVSADKGLPVSAQSAGESPVETPRKQRDYRETQEEGPQGPPAQGPLGPPSPSPPSDTRGEFVTPQGACEDSLDASLGAFESPTLPEDGLVDSQELQGPQLPPEIPSEGPPHPPEQKRAVSVEGPPSLLAAVRSAR